MVGPRVGELPLKGPSRDLQVPAATKALGTIERRLYGTPIRFFMKRLLSWQLFAS
jgi:hypothetical protein